LQRAETADPPVPEEPVPAGQPAVRSHRRARQRAAGYVGVDAGLAGAGQRDVRTAVDMGAAAAPVLRDRLQVLIPADTTDGGHREIGALSLLSTTRL